MGAIIQVVEDWSLAKDRKYTVFAIFFDFAKAFDLVDHEDHEVSSKARKAIPEMVRFMDCGLP